MTFNRKRVISGIKPTNKIHLGNYFGTIDNLKKLLKDGHEVFSFVADLHSLTTGPQEKSNILFTIKSFMASVEEKAIIYVQSDFPQIPYFSWLISSFAGYGELCRMTQFKALAEKYQSNAAMFTYPVLMAADILISGASLVPTGQDQKQHIELARDIFLRIMNSVEEYIAKSELKEKEGKQLKSLLVEPNILLSKAVKILDLQSNSKMSKSNDNPQGSLLMTDDDNSIYQKIIKAKTDSLPMPSAEEDLDLLMSGRPEVYNLCKILSLVEDIEIEDVLSRYGGKMISSFKKDLADSLIKFIRPIREKIFSISDKEAIERIERDKEKISNIFDERVSLLKRIMFY